MAKKCGLAKEPEGYVCLLLESDGHVACVDGAGHSWPHPVRSKQRGPINRHLDRGLDPKRIIPEAAKRTPPEVGAAPIETGVPAQAVAQWTRTAEGRAWIDNAYRELVALSQRMAEFTTPEHLWPLLDAPREKRALSQAVQRALRRGEITEVGAKRLREVYHSRDGVRFPMNKLAPVYARPV